MCTLYNLWLASVGSFLLLSMFYLGFETIVVASTNNLSSVMNGKNDYVGLFVVHSSYASVLCLCLIVSFIKNWRLRRKLNRVTTSVDFLNRGTTSVDFLNRGTTSVDSYRHM